ncbi:hypothetical protein Trydic_g3576 [Trypoxylus dichotomus]
MGQEPTKILCFADDAILMADNEDDLERLLYRFQTKAKSLNMQISVEKTESMVIPKSPLDIRSKLIREDPEIQGSMAYEGETTVLQGPPCQNGRKSIGEMGKGYKTSQPISQEMVRQLEIYFPRGLTTLRRVEEARLSLRKKEKRGLKNGLRMYWLVH